MAETAKTKKKSVGSQRAKSGLPAKAGRRRPPHIKSEIDFYGKRQWTAGVQTKTNQVKQERVLKGSSFLTISAMKTRKYQEKLYNERKLVLEQA